MASDIWLRTILIAREETRCCHIGYSYRLTARVLLYAPSHRQDNTYHSLCYTSRGALVGTRNSSMGPPHEESIRRPIAPWANALPLSYVLLPSEGEDSIWKPSTLRLALSNKPRADGPLNRLVHYVSLIAAGNTKLFIFNEVELLTSYLLHFTVGGFYPVP